MLLLRLNPDTRLLFAARTARLFGYGLISVVLVLYLAQAGLTTTRIGALLALTLLGDTVISLRITTMADRVGRRRMLLFGAVLMLLAGVLFTLTRNFWLLLVAATIGVISPSGSEVGPFLSIEQATLSQLVSDTRRTQVFAWYNLAGCLATAAGALTAGALAQGLQASGSSPLSSYRCVIVAYAFVAVILALLFLQLSPDAEAPVREARPPGRMLLGLHRSRKTVFRLSGLFAMDAFAGALVLQSIIAYWFHIRFGTRPAALGGILFGANVLAGFSALGAAWLADRIGLINTMVVTHIPSNVLLMLVPLMPNASLATLVLLVRYSISQMDVPTRQSYTMAAVSPDERSAAAGVTGVARTTGASLSPALSGHLLSFPALLGVPFFLAGGLKIVYDLLLYASFRSATVPGDPPERARSDRVNG